MPTFTLPIAYLDTLQRVGKACYTDKMTSTIGGIRIKIAGGSIETAATDGKILAHHIGDIENPTGLECEVILPWAHDKRLQSWIKSHAKGRGEVILLIDNRQVTIQANGETTIRRTIEGTFPSYAGAFRCENPYTHAFSGDDMTTALDILGGKGFQAVKIQQGRGWTFRRLSGSDSMQVLVMPVTMPDQKTWVQVESTEYAKLLQDVVELRKLKGEA